MRKDETPEKLHKIFEKRGHLGTRGTHKWNAKGLPAILRSIAKNKAIIGERKRISKIQPGIRGGLATTGIPKKKMGYLKKSIFKRKRREKENEKKGGLATQSHRS